MKIRCIIIEDEGIARRALMEYIDQVDVLSLQGSFKNALSANDYIQNNEIDLLFLDIEMPQLNGLQLLRALKISIPVIFTTAYTRFAMDSFEFDVVDYLLKPISFERFLQAVNKSTRFLGIQSPSQELSLYVKDGAAIKRISVGEIKFVEAMQNYIKIHSTHGVTMTLMTLKEFLSQLPADGFVQTHRSFVVNVSKVIRIEGEQAFVDGESVPISRRLKSEVLRHFNDKHQK